MTGKSRKLKWRDRNGKAKECELDPNMAAGRICPYCFRRPTQQARNLQGPEKRDHHPSPEDGYVVCGNIRPKHLMPHAPYLYTTFRRFPEEVNGTPHMSRQVFVSPWVTCDPATFLRRHIDVLGEDVQKE